MDRKKLYEKFHEHVSIMKNIPNARDFTYGIILKRIDPLIKPGKTALDIGCGNGILSLYLGNKGMQVLGTDISKKAIDSASASAKFHGFENKVKFTTEDFAKGEIEGEFDLIVFTEVVEHLPDDSASLRKIYELTKKGGYLFLSTPSEKAPMHRLKILFFGKDQFDINVGHLRRYTAEGISEKIERTGFTIEGEFKTEGVLRNFVFVTSLGNNLLRFMRWKAKDIFAVADDISKSLFGESQIIIIAKKK